MALKLEPVRGGFEPLIRASLVVDNQSFSVFPRSEHTQIRAQNQGAHCRELSEVVAIWSQLPKALQDGILAIVRSQSTALPVNPPEGKFAASSKPKHSRSAISPPTRTSQGYTRGGDEPLVPNLAFPKKGQKGGEK